MLRWNRALAIAAVAVALPVAAVAGVRPAVRLLQPEPGAILEPGDSAVLEWAADGRLPGHAQEWEAFLSLDGGRTWTTRLTPHLDVDIRRVSWRVPNVPASDARILLRIGNEIREESVECPRVSASPPGLCRRSTSRH